MTNSVWGPADAPTIILLHGFMGAGDNWEPVARALPEYRIVAPDLPGHGSSTAMSPDSYTLSGAVALCTKFMGRLSDSGRSVALLAGYSMGGRLVQEILATGPLTNTMGVCLLGAHPGLPDKQSRAERLTADRKLAGRIEDDFEAMLEDWLKLPLFSTLSPTQRRAIMTERLRRCRPTELARSLCGLSTGHQPDRRSVLKREASRVTLVAGARDDRYQALLSGLGLELVSVAGAGHNVIAEQPLLLAGILRRLALARRGRGA
ncbi:MAG: 2-succinyl-6-hydroxy-2,4-cyclohexadiene-1-carboxylate synthase [Rhodothermales bacterium]